MSGFNSSSSVKSVLGNQKSGFLVLRATPDSFASKIGLKPGLFQADIFGQKIWIGGDIILSIQGLRCNATHDLGTLKSAN